MHNIVDKIYTIIILIKNIIIRKKHYTLRFVAERDSVIKRWYYDFKHWGFDHSNLEMVAGADALCERYADGKDEVTVEVYASNVKLGLSGEKYDIFIAEDMNDYAITFIDKLLYGRTYFCSKLDNKGIEQTTMIWICPVTLFVLGRYPKYLYVHIKNNNS